MLCGKLFQRRGALLEKERERECQEGRRYEMSKSTILDQEYKKIRKIHEEVTKLQASKLSKSANFVRIFWQSNGDQKVSKRGC